MKSFKRISFLLAIVFLIIAINLNVFADIFVIKKIQVQGLHRISLATVISYLPIKEGDTLTGYKTANIIRALYKTGFFSDVNLSRDGDTLIIHVEERAVIGAINISGNKKVTKKQLLESLKASGFYEGQPYDISILAALKQALIQQYYSFGHYNVSIATKAVKLARNRVSVNIKIDEGAMAKIREIKILGNKAFSNRKLLREFSLTTSKPWSFLTHSDQYAKEKLDADLENLRSFYLDHGYLQFKVVSKNVSFTPDKKAIYIVIRVSEGPIYRISGWKVVGDLIGKDDEINKLISIKDEDIFSRHAIIENSNRISRYIGDYGYAMPNIQTEPSIDEKNRRVFITFKVDPGKRIYVRRINFFGNTKTQESVLRRQMRQQEGGLFSISKVNESKRKLNNLVYLQNVDARMESVPGHPDEVDLNFDVKESSSAGANLNIGYSDVDKLIFGASISEQNFLGTGKGVSVNFNKSHYTTNYSFDYYNPYYTINNISLGMQIYATRTEPTAIHLSPYITDAYGFSAIYGIPLSDYSNINFGYGLEHFQYKLSEYSSSEMRAFANRYHQTFDTVRLISGWNYNKLDRAIFPTNGFANSFGIEFGVPTGLSSGKLEYYKVREQTIYYRPLFKSFVMRLNGELGYGNGYGAMHDLPFFKNFYCGGLGSVRGYEASSLGPRDSLKNPMGGNVLADASLGIIFPNPFGETFRTSVFADAGNVYHDQFKIKDFRTSSGIQAEWRSPLGAIFTFSLAKALNRHAGDRIESFQFNLGASL